MIAPREILLILNYVPMDATVQGSLGCPQAVFPLFTTISERPFFRQSVDKRSLNTEALWFQTNNMCGEPTCGEFLHQAFCAHSGWLRQ